MDAWRPFHLLSHRLGSPRPEGRTPLQTLPAMAEDDAFRYTPPGVAAAVDERRELESQSRGVALLGGPRMQTLGHDRLLTP
jgi:hypothetical protein